MRLIDADAYKSKYCNGCSYFKQKSDECLNCPVTEIDAMPTIELGVTKHGEWLIHKNFDGNLKCYECSYCGQKQGYISNYCEECGAKMSIEQEN